MIYFVTDCEFNQTNYPNLIGRIYSNPPSYAIVIQLPDPYRKHSCWKCKNDWIAKVELDSKTINLSGEQSQYCPNCETKSSCASCWIQSNGDEYPFPKPVLTNKRKEN